MGKIFGISDLPASTIMTPFEPLVDFKPAVSDCLRSFSSKDFEQKTDTFISKEVKPKSNSIIKMRNGFGKLMKHFSKKI